MTLRELMDELDYVSVDVEREIRVVDGQGNELEITFVGEEEGTLRIDVF